MEKRPQKPDPPNQRPPIPIVDDATLLTLVTFLYAFFQFMATFGLQRCEC